MAYEPNKNTPTVVLANSLKPAIIPFYGWQDLLSNHHPAGFTVKGLRFQNSEMFLMYCKAKLFEDHATAEKILNCQTAQGCKILGRLVTPYDDNFWKTKRRPIAYRGCLQKAIEHLNIREFLLSTGNAILVEASGTDRDWGAGLTKDDPRIYDPTQWEGANIQGEVWMQVRRKLQEEVIF